MHFKIFHTEKRNQMLQYTNWKYADGQGTASFQARCHVGSSWYSLIQKRSVGNSKEPLQFSTLRSKLSLCSHRQRTLPKPPSHSCQWTLSRSLQDSLCRDKCIDRTIDIKRQEFAHGYFMYIIQLMLPVNPDAPTFDLV